MVGRGRTRRRAGVAVALLALLAAAITGGFALRDASREVVSRAPDDRTDALRRLEADRVGRERRARADGSSRRRSEAARERATGAARSTPEPRRRALRRGSGYASRAGSDRVRRLQRALLRLNLVPEEVLSPSGQPVLLVGTGQFGPATERGVRRFQRRAKLPVTGIADARTLDRIYAAARAQGRKR